MKYKSKKEFLDSVVDNYSDQKEFHQAVEEVIHSIWNTAANNCLLYTSPSPRDLSTSRMPSSA